MRVGNWAGRDKKRLFLLGEGGSSLQRGLDWSGYGFGRDSGFTKVSPGK